MVRTYLSRGDYFGEIGLLRSIKRTATCAALDAVDVVKIPASEFNLMLEKFPDVRAQLEPVAEARLTAIKERTLPAGLRLDEADRPAAKRHRRQLAVRRERDPHVPEPVGPRLGQFLARRRVPELQIALPLIESFRSRINSDGTDQHLAVWRESADSATGEFFGNWDRHFFLARMDLNQLDRGREKSVTTRLSH